MVMAGAIARPPDRRTTVAAVHTDASFLYDSKTSSAASRLRSVEETEAAHELLQLAMSGPPLSPASTSQQCHTFIIYTRTASNSGRSDDVEDGDVEGEDDDDGDGDGYDDLRGHCYIGSSTRLPPLSATKTAVSTGTVTAASGIKLTYADRSLLNVCSVCGKRYATASNLARHKQTHQSLDSSSARQCGTCGKRYVSMPALAMHVLTHQQQHRCHLCGKQFSRPWLLRGHLRSHTGERPYGCRLCGKRFADRSNLRAHVQTHNGSKVHRCGRCHKTFALKSYLAKHCESVCHRKAPV